MISKAEWIAEYLGNPAEWQVTHDGTIRDTARPARHQIVGRVTRKDGLAVIHWNFSGTTSTFSDWDDQ